MTHRRSDFIVFSDDWARHPSSCQHLFKRISKDHRVLWINTIGLRTPRADRFTLFRGLEKIRQWRRPVERVSENLWIYSPIMLPVWGSGKLSTINRRLVTAGIRRLMRRLDFHRPIVWTTIPTAGDYIGRLDEDRWVYYVTDDYRHWPGADSQKIYRADLDLTSIADRVFACSDALLQSHRSPESKSLLLPHAVDVDHFSTPQPAPAELDAIPHPRACFFGLVYEKIDLDALHRLASDAPELQLVMIGPVKTDVERFKTHKNVHFLGPKPYEQLPAYLQTMDVIVVPYLPDEQIQVSSPLKIRECLALGKPTVARRIADLEPFADLIDLYDDPDQLSAKVRHALSKNGAQHMRQRVQADTWDSRAQFVLAELQKPFECTVEVSTGEPQWDRYLASQSTTGLFHDPRWGRVMKQAYNNQPYYLTAKRDGQVVGILQLVEQRSRLFGAHLVSLPYFDASGILADDEQARECLISHAKRLSAALQVRWAELRADQPTDRDIPTRTEKITFRRNLPADEQALWNELDPKVRNQIRKAQSAAMTVDIGGSEWLDDFYRVYVRNMRDLGSPPHSRRFFQILCDAFHKDGIVHLYVIRHQGVSVAGGLTLTDRTCSIIPWAASDWRYKSLCPNMLLYWSILEDCCRRGVRTFDFGRSTRDSGTCRFKKQWGAEPQQLYWYYLPAPGQTIPDFHAQKTHFDILSRCWRWLPVPLARRLGPAIIRKLS